MFVFSIYIISVFLVLEYMYVFLEFLISDGKKVFSIRRAQNCMSFGFISVGLCLIFGTFGVKNCSLKFKYLCLGAVVKLYYASKRSYPFNG